ncbi:hypothetical protein NC653_027000 [Populus alba x Populus x berolinensis]|uniref:Uncharacterized protein n=1 Tax=Populus alba x Populus x berolinensis TaxID=444605 RepID=A0AAD6Q6A8_9ROSI|nr:hypothetical protein NC653_027000 [Populus alba x Populus x berolinensis]
MKKIHLKTHLGGRLIAVRRPISGHRGIGGGQLLVLLTEMKRYLLEMKRVGTGNIECDLKSSIIQAARTSTLMVP